MRRALIFIGVLISVCSAGPAAAQTSSPSPAAPGALAATVTPLPIDIEHQTEIAFPHEIFFRANIKLSITEVSSVSLIIETINGTRVEVVYPQEPFLFASDEIIATYVWKIPRDNPPLLFQPLRYTWKIVRTNGQTYNDVQALNFTDERFDWRVTEAADRALLIAAPSSLDRSISTIQTNLTDALTLLQRNTGQTPAMRLMIYDTNLRPGCPLNARQEPVYNGYLRDGTREERPCDPEQADALYKASGYTVLQIGTEGNPATLLTNSLVQKAYETVWNGKPVPLWFEAGLEQFYQQQANRGALFISRDVLRGGSPFTVTQLNQEPLPSDALVWRAQAYGMILYLASRTSVEDVFALGRDIAQAESFDSAFQTRFGFSVQNLIDAWKIWLFKQEAENVYLYTPYLATTPTPTVTPTVTNTPVPPTPTETLTPTREIPTRPPVTITRRPPTPTVTPLPAQGFNLRPTAVPPTPIPDTPLDVIKRGNNPYIIGGGLVAVLLVIFISFVTGRRRG